MVLIHAVVCNKVKQVLDVIHKIRQSVSPSYFTFFSLKRPFEFFMNDIL